MSDDLVELFLNRYSIFLGIFLIWKKSKKLIEIFSYFLNIIELNKNTRYVEKNARYKNHLRKKNKTRFAKKYPAYNVKLPDDKIIEFLSLKTYQLKLLQKKKFSDEKNWCTPDLPPT